MRRNAANGLFTNPSILVCAVAASGGNTPFVVCGRRIFDLREGGNGAKIGNGESDNRLEGRDSNPDSQIQRMQSYR